MSGWSFVGKSIGKTGIQIITSHAASRIFLLSSHLISSCFKKYPYVPNPTPGKSLCKPINPKFIPYANCAEAVAGSKIIKTLSSLWRRGPK